MFDLEQDLDRLFGWVDGERAQKCIGNVVRIAYVIALVMIAANISNLIDIYRGIPSP